TFTWILLLTINLKLVHRPPYPDEARLRRRVNCIQHTHNTTTNMENVLRKYKSENPDLVSTEEMSYNHKEKNVAENLKYFRETTVSSTLNTTPRHS
ncbi:hypothetical protein JRQ81_019857, partial [Phrynocephalus forsythii]